MSQKFNEFSYLTKELFKATPKVINKFAVLAKFYSLCINKEKCITFSLYLVIITVLAGFTSFAQQPGNIEFTPLALAPGAPSGTQAITDTERINMNNGNFSYSLPFMNIGGRGSVNFSLRLNIEQHWQVTALGGNTYAYPNQESLTRFKKKMTYDPGKMTGRKMVGGQSVYCGGQIQQHYSYKSLTQFYFTASDGTEIVLVDKQTMGMVNTFSNPCSEQYSRGNTFVAADGTLTTFISDQAFAEDGSAPSNEYLPSGYLIFRDGSRYRIADGLVQWMADRNGNRITFTYGDFEGDYYYKKLTDVVDSVGRSVHIEYDVTDVAPYGLCDRITYTGFDGNPKVTRISKTDFSNALRSGFTPKKYNDLFAPYGFTNGQGVLPNLVPSALWLPDGQKKYKFLYNSFYELARVELPTGGAIEYDYTGGLINGHPEGLVCNYYGRVYRRLVERRVYTDGINLTGKTTYSRAEQTTPTGTCFLNTSTDITNIGYVNVENFDNIGQRLSSQRHYFYGGVIDSLFQNMINVPAPFGWKVGKEYKTEILDIDGSTVLQRIESNWYQTTPSWWTGSPDDAPGNNPKTIEVTTTLLDTGQVTKTSSVNPNNPTDIGFDQFQNQTDLYMYDYGNGSPGPLLRHTHTEFLTTNNGIDYTTDNIHIFNLPVKQWVKGYGSNGQELSNYASYAEMLYDEPTYPLLTYNNETIVGWTDPNTTVRGNVTTTKAWLDSNNSFIVAHSQYDQLGNLRKAWDPNNNLRSFDFSDRFGSPDGEARNNNAPTSLNGAKTYAYPTSTTNELGWVTYAQYNYYSGMTVNTEDYNGAISKTLYEDPLDRPTKSVSAVGTEYEVQSNTFYDDANHQVVIKSDLNTLNDNLVKTVNLYDGFGRKIETHNFEDSNNYIAVETKFDSFGRGYKISNPYRPNEINASNPVQWTETKFDALGRAKELVYPDQTSMITTYLGNVSTLTDQTLRKRRVIKNALGEIVRIDEPDNNNDLGSLAAPKQPTSYKYNSTGKLVEVTQDTQKRYFMYDSLGRLLRVRQPEQITTSVLTLSDAITGNNLWNVGYTYDNTGNILTSTDSNNITTSYEYDALSRKKKRISSDTLTPTVDYFYDGTGLTLMPQFAKGRLTKVSNGISETKYTAYDVTGKLLASEQKTPFGNETLEQTLSRTMYYKYNLSGTLIEQRYPSGRVVKNTLVSDGKLTAIDSKVANGQFINYAANIGYTSARKIEKLQLGNGLWETAKFNNRIQVREIGLGTSPTDTSIWKLEYKYGEIDSNGTYDENKNNGNIAKQVLSFAGLSSSLTQSYKYDSLLRITEAKEGNATTETWKQTWNYDRFGNRNAFTHVVDGQTVPLDSKNFPQIDSDTNKFAAGQGYQYDNNGNIIQDPDNRQFIYNGDGKQTEVKNLDLPSNANTIGRYYYDGEGRRVKKVTSTETTIFVYDASSRLVAEYSNQTEQSPTTNYVLTDTLQSVRVITDKNASVVQRRDFKPFGEEVGIDGVIRTSGNKYSTNNMSRVRPRFTGYQKDTETQLDFAEARYYNNQHGRFTAIDPLLASGVSANPQTFNRYTYTMNRPLKLTDPSGLQSTQRDRSVVLRAEDVKPVSEPYSGIGYEAKWVQNRGKADEKFLENVKVDLNRGAITELNKVQVEAEQLIVAQRENSERATEYGAAAVNQIRSSGISDEITEFYAHGLVGAYINGGGPGHLYSPEQFAELYTDATGQLNIPGVSTSGTVTASQYVGAETSTAANYSSGDLTAMFQNAANTDLGLLNSLQNEKAAQDFANKWKDNPVVVHFERYDIPTFQDPVGLYNIYYGLYWARLKAAREAALQNQTDTRTRLP